MQFVIIQASSHIFVRNSFFLHVCALHMQKYPDDKRSGLIVFSESTAVCSPFELIIHILNCREITHKTANKAKKKLTKKISTL